MKSAVNVILFILFLPLIVLFGAVLLFPIVLFLLILLFFIPSIRVVHLFQDRREKKRNGAAPGPAEDDDPVDVECTVVETSEEEMSEQQAAPEKLNR